ncbi:hypothetical protein LJB42_000430 [Komagataella kurtzmanii]|nr:hypothetical protein LJB42_000430 [Komagataella kurtzmanii]
MSPSVRTDNGTIIKWMVVLVLSLGLLWECFVSFHFGSTPHDPLLRLQHVAPIENKTRFRIRHIYHHNSGKSHRVHKRLDITDQFIARFDLDQPNISGLVNTDGNEDGEFDDPETLMPYFSRESPWVSEFDMSGYIGSIRRMAERDPDFVESYLAYARESGAEQVSKITLDWNDDRDILPNVTNNETIMNLALMSSNAYVRIPGEGDWKDVNKPWSVNKTDEEGSTGFGWMEDGVRGHVFTNEDSSIVILSIKGTSAQGLPGGGGESDTIEEDKINDNLLFSCCCARVSYMWTTVCDCYKSSYTCDEDCLEKELYREDRYYRAVLDVYRNVTNLYPDSAVWVTGHSLGAALAGLLGRTYGLPAVTFEAPGDLLATKRLHLPQPPSLPSYLEHIWHFGHTADPIFMGTCNGASSSCSVAGYAMETQCHSGKVCIYDVVNDYGWHVNLVNHRIHTVIDSVLTAYNKTASCEIPLPCHDCYNWNFITRDRHKGRDGDDKNKPKEPKKPQKCLRRSWYGRCLEWGDDDSDDVST